MVGAQRAGWVGDTKYGVQDRLKDVFYNTGNIAYIL